MTYLAKPVVRHHVTLQGAALVVTLAPEGIYYREKGRRTTYGPLAHGYLFQKAVEQHVLGQERDKPKRKLKVNRGLLSHSR